MPRCAVASKRVVAGRDCQTPRRDATMDKPALQCHLPETTSRVESHRRAEEATTANWRFDENRTIYFVLGNKPDAIKSLALVIKNVLTAADFFENWPLRSIDSENLGNNSVLHSTIFVVRVQSTVALVQSS